MFRRSLPREAKEFLQKKLGYEYELYIFAKQRLKKQQRELKLWKLKTQKKKKTIGKIKKIKALPAQR